MYKEGDKGELTIFFADVDGNPNRKEIYHATLVEIRYSQTCSPGYFFKINDREGIYSTLLHYDSFVVDVPEAVIATFFD